MLFLFVLQVLRQLRKRQKKAFRGLHEWMADVWDCELATSDGVWRLPHSDVTVARVGAMVRALDAPALTALQLATMESKSLILGLALVLRHVRVQNAALTKPLRLLRP